MNDSWLSHALKRSEVYNYLSGAEGRGLRFYQLFSHLQLFFRSGDQTI